MERTWSRIRIRIVVHTNHDYAVTHLTLSMQPRQTLACMHLCLFSPCRLHINNAMHVHHGHLAHHYACTSPCKQVWRIFMHDPCMHASCHACMHLAMHAVASVRPDVMHTSICLDRKLYRIVLIHAPCPCPCIRVHVHAFMQALPVV